MPPWVAGDAVTCEEAGRERSAERSSRERRKERASEIKGAEVLVAAIGTPPQCQPWRDARPHLAFVRLQHRSAVTKKCLRRGAERVIDIRQGHGATIKKTDREAFPAVYQSQQHAPHGMARPGRDISPAATNSRYGCLLRTHTVMYSCTHMHAHTLTHSPRRGRPSDPINAAQAYEGRIDEGTDGEPHLRKKQDNTQPG